MKVSTEFLNKEDIDSEYFYELQPASCSKCTTFQIVNVPDPKSMFHDHYAYFASTSTIMTKHFKKLAEDVMGNQPVDGSDGVS